MLCFGSMRGLQSSSHSFATTTLSDHSAKNISKAIRQIVPAVLTEFQTTLRMDRNFERKCGIPKHWGLLVFSFESGLVNFFKIRLRRWWLA